MPTQVSLLDGALASAGTLAIQTNGTTSAITISSAQVATFVNNPIMTGLTASRAVFTDGSKGLTSNAITGTGNVVMSASPTLTGTISGAAITLSSDLTLSGGTANGVLYLNGSKVATSGSALTFDGSGLAVGDTSAGGYSVMLGNGSSNRGRIYIKGATGGNYPEINLDDSMNTSGRRWQVYSTSGALVFGDTTSGEQMRLTSTGLGIGTSSPSQKLHINVASGSVYEQISSGSNNVYLGFDNSRTVGAIQSNNALVFDVGSTYTERARIDSSGNLGVGTTTMTRNFNIGGSNAAVGMNINNTGTSGRSYSIFSTNSSASAVGALGFYDDTAGSYRMVIDSSGNLLVGATGATSNSRLSVKGSSTSASDLNFFFVNSAGSTVLAAYNNGALYADNMKSGAGTNTVKFSTSTGQITYDTSSARYKDNIRDSIYGLSHVMQMRSAQFEYKDDGRSDVGLIAEELDPIIPELVGKNKEGQPDSVSYDRMVSVLVKAIQELKTEVDSLKAQLNKGA